MRISLDLVRLFLNDDYDAAILFSQDQDLLEATQEVKHLARSQGKVVALYSAFPVGPGSKNQRGIDRTDWIRIDQVAYDQCVDPRDYR